MPPCDNVTATATPNVANGWVVTLGTSWALVDYPIANFGVNFGCLILLQASDGSLVQVSISGIPGS